MAKIEALKKNKFIQLWLIIGLIAGFAAVIFFTLTYLNQKVMCDLDCRIKNEVNLLLVMISLFGVFIGSLTYYFISEKYEKKIDRIHKDVSQTLRFLEGEERKIITSLIDNQGENTQAEIVKNTGLSRVKVSRILSKLEQKGIIKKIPNGMTNTVALEDELKEVLLD
jgi:uncharacterized membrane protein